LVLDYISHGGKYGIKSYLWERKNKMAIFGRDGGIVEEETLENLATLELCKKWKTGWRLTKKGKALVALWGQKYGWQNSS
jgi:hypothetical protein